MNSFDFQKARQFLLQKEQKRKQILENRYADALNDFNVIVNHIIKNYNPLRIYQWGSLLTKDHFSEISDIDIGLEGIDSIEDMFKIYGDVLDISSFKVDIVQMEKIEPEFADIIKEKGKIVYERKD